MEGRADPSDQKETQAEGKVHEPSNASAGPTLNPLKLVDGERVKHRAGMHLTPIAEPKGSMCSKCASVSEELKKMKSSENATKKKLSVKIGTISKLRNMLEEAQIKAKDLTSRALSAESALRASEAKLVETEAKLAEADERAHTTKVQLSEIDIRALKSEVKACKFEVKLEEAEGRIQKAMSDLSKAEQRAHKLEEKLMEAMQRTSSAEAKLTEIEARLKESQRMACGVKVEGGVAGKDGKKLRLGLRRNLLRQRL